MSKDLHRYGIMKHRKGTSYEHDCFVCDKNYMPLSLSHETAEMMIRQFHFQYGNDYSFRIRRLD